ncbi:MAG: GGDEF domain-containing protein [Dehalococcoidia bacterium]
MNNAHERIADIMEICADQVAAEWQNAATSACWITSGTDSTVNSAVTQIATWLRGGQDHTLAGALRLPPWGNGAETAPSAPGLVMPLRRAVAHAAGESKDLHMALDDMAERILLALARDARRRESRLRQMADHDALTGVLTRRAILAELEIEAARARRFNRPLSVLYLDMDGLKSINDRNGHSAGDHALLAVTSLIRANTRLTDRLGRLGGDEFLLVMPDTDGAQAQAVSNKLKRIASESMSTKFSTGAAGPPAVMPDADALVTAADEALARSRQKNQCTAATHHTEADLLG